MKSITFLLLALSVYSCNPRKNSSENSNAKNIDTIDFCKTCDLLAVWIGGIQGVPFSDSTGGYPFAECHTNKSYDLIWVPKGDILKFKSSMGNDSLLQYYKLAEKDTFREMNCYAFVIGKKSRIPDENLDEFDYIFPSNVEIFKKADNTWMQMPTKTVQSFEELGRLKLNTIFQIN